MSTGVAAQTPRPTFNELDQLNASQQVTDKEMIAGGVIGEIVNAADQARAAINTIDHERAKRARAAAGQPSPIAAGQIPKIIVNNAGLEPTYQPSQQNLKIAEEIVNDISDDYERCRVQDIVEQGYEHLEQQSQQMQQVPEPAAYAQVSTQENTPPKSPKSPEKQKHTSNDDEERSWDQYTDDELLLSRNDEDDILAKASSNASRQFSTGPYKSFFAKEFEQQEKARQMRSFTSNMSAANSNKFVTTRPKSVIDGNVSDKIKTFEQRPKSAEPPRQSKEVIGKQKQLDINKFVQQTLNLKPKSVEGSKPQTPPRRVLQ